ncbi:MAG: DNA polymerase I [Actinomycetota bacterium]|nr:DNA polymerase I [Actinomycetota bacterium]
MSTVMLVDGNSLTYRAFFALPTDMATAGGQVTNAVFGFTSMMINLLRDHQPNAVVVAFDRPEPTFRHEAVATYKANRDEAPDILRQQMGLVRQVVEALRFPIVELVGYEADDIIATLATRGRDRGDDVIIVTGDRDSYQLVEDPHVKVLYNKRGVSDYVLYDEAGIAERTGVSPDRYVQYAAMRGDNSDNLPGVPGVGEKTAAKLVNKYGDLDGIFAHVDEQTPKLRENLGAHEDQVRKNAEVMVLVRDAPVELSLDELSAPAPDMDEVRRLFDFLEFRTLVDRLSEALGEIVEERDVEVLEAEVDRCDTPAEAAAALAALADLDGPVVVAPAFAGPDDRGALVGVALVSDAEAAQTLWVTSDQLEDGAVSEAFRKLVGAGGRGVVAHGAKPVLRALAVRGIEVGHLALDTRIAAYLLDPAESRYLLDELLLRYADLVLPDSDPEPQGQLDLDGGVDDRVDEAVVAARAALATARLVAPLEAALEAQGLTTLNDDIEVPLVRVLAKMETTGVAVDRDELQDLNDTLAAEAAELTAALYEDAGREFNVNSTKQLREILFEELELTPSKRTKTGYSTDATSLEKLRGQHVIIDHLLRYREVEKLRSTYGEALIAEIAPDGRIHATFNQTVARTGRLSSEDPNLHNIPVRSELGRNFRKAFVPGEGFELLVADYNQIELRCIAHLAEDPGLIAAFEAREDIHTATAARVFDVEPDAVTLDQRSKAKMVSYGLAYGMEAYGLGQRLNIPTGEAAVILEAYFEAFPSVKAYMDSTVAEARERGYTETLFGRRRQIPELSSGNYRIRQAGERQAMNAGIQGLAADIFKVALVNLDRELEEADARSRLILQVHDEVILEVAPEEKDDIATVTFETMANAFELRVPLEVNLSFGRSWADAK